MGKRILMTTTGSYGDLHPFIAIGLELKSRGHEVTIATSDFYRDKVERTGLKFSPMGPHLQLDHTELMDRVLNLKDGPRFLIREILYPAVPAAYEEVINAAKDAEIIVTHPITFASQIAAEKLGLPWISTVTAPLSFFSRYDPSVVAAHPQAIRLRALGPQVYGLLLKLGRLQTHFWREPISRFRKSIGLPPGRDPIFDGQHSPQRVLAMFSPLIAPPQPDWPRHTIATGFPFYDQAEHGQKLSPDLQSFLDSGPAPVVFTLGSSAVQRPGEFYGESVEAVRRLGCRAVFLIGTGTIPANLPAGSAAFSYAPYSQILPRAAVTVHSGGIGTSAQALASGRPMLVVPFAFDQPDNAARLQRLGVARSIPRAKYNARRAFEALTQLLASPEHALKARAISQQLLLENGARTASDIIEHHSPSR